MLKETEDKFKDRLLKDIKRLCEVSDNLYLDTNNFNLVFDHYRRYRIAIHNRIEQGNEEKKDQIRMDRHKIAAAFFCAIMKANPIGRKPDAQKFLERTINIQLALLFSTVFIINLFNVSDSKNTDIDKKIYSRIFKLPKCKQSESKNYITNLIMLIEDVQIQNFDIDSESFQPSLLFVISHLFFVLDAYSYQENKCITFENESNK